MVALKCELIFIIFLILLVAFVICEDDNQCKFLDFNVPISAEMQLTSCVGNLPFNKQSYSDHLFQSYRDNVDYFLLADLVQDRYTCGIFPVTHWTTNSRLNIPFYIDTESSIIEGFIIIYWINLEADIADQPSSNVYTFIDYALGWNNVDFTLEENIPMCQIKLEIKLHDEVFAIEYFHVFDSDEGRDTLCNTVPVTPEPTTTTTEDTATTEEITTTTESTITTPEATTLDPDTTTSEQTTATSEDTTTITEVTITTTEDTTTEAIETTETTEAIETTEITETTEVITTTEVTTTTSEETSTIPEQTTTTPEVTTTTLEPITTTLKDTTAAPVQTTTTPEQTTTTSEVTPSTSTTATEYPLTPPTTDTEFPIPPLPQPQLEGNNYIWMILCIIFIILFVLSSCACLYAHLVRSHLRPTQGSVSIITRPDGTRSLVVAPDYIKQKSNFYWIADKAGKVK